MKMLRDLFRGILRLLHGVCICLSLLDSIQLKKSNRIFLPNDNHPFITPALPSNPTTRLHFDLLHFCFPTDPTSQTRASGCSSSSGSSSASLTSRRTRRSTHWRIHPQLPALNRPACVARRLATSSSPSAKAT